jgi:hypothetical protein
MAFILTAGSDGEQRYLGNTQFTYDATNGRWVRNNANTGSPVATITATWDGYLTGTKLISGQYATINILWNKGFPNTLFTQANVSIATSTIGSYSILPGSFTSSTDPLNGNLTYTFKYTFSGAYSQVQIQPNQFSVNTLPNIISFSTVLPGVYLPYAQLSPVAKINTAPVYSFTDPNYPGVTRYFSNNLNAINGGSANTRRLAVTFQNFISVPNTGTAALTNTKITANSQSVGANNYVNVLNGAINTGNIKFVLSNVANTTSYGNTAANTFSNPRYFDMYQPSLIAGNTNIINRLIVSGSSYQDNGVLNDSGSAMYFANLPNTAIKVVPYYNRTSGTSISKISLFLDHYTAMVATANSANVTAQYGTLSGFALDTSDVSGTSYTVSYTPNTTTYASSDYVESITIKANTFIVPAATSNISLNGLTLSYDANGGIVTANVWSNSRTNILTTGTFNVYQSLLTPSSYNNYSNVTVWPAVTLTYPRTVWTNTGGTGTYSIYDRNNSLLYNQSNSNGAITGTQTTTVSLGQNINVTDRYAPYYIKLDGGINNNSGPGALKDDWGNYSTFFGIAGCVLSANTGFYNYSSVNTIGFNTIGNTKVTLKLVAPFPRTYLNSAPTLTSSNLSYSTSGSSNGTISNIRSDPSDVNAWLIDWTPGPSDSGTFTINLLTTNSADLSLGLKYQYPSGSGAIYNSLSVGQNYLYDSRSFTVSSTNPTSGATGVSAVPFNVIFNKTMNVASINTSAISLVKGSSYAGGTVVPFTYVTSITTNTNDTISISPNPPSSISPGDQYWINLAANTVYDTYGNPSGAYGPYTFTMSSGSANQAIYTAISGTNNTFSWYCPLFVSSVSVLTVGMGGMSTAVSGCCGPTNGSSGGGLSYKNNISVVPGLTYTVTINGTESSFANGGTKICVSLAGGRGQTTAGGLGGGTILGVVNDGGGTGGAGGTTNSIFNGGSGGAGGYAGNGGNGYDPNTSTPAQPAATGSGGGGGGNSGNSYQGGGVGLYGKGADGSVNQPGSGGSGMDYGGGGNYFANQPGGSGAVRIVWGTGRSFPSTNVSTANT